MANWWDPDDEFIAKLLEAHAAEFKMIERVTLISLDGLTKTLEVAGQPKYIDSPVYSEGRDYGTRRYERDKFRDGEYRELPPVKEKKAELKTYQTLVRDLATNFALQGDNTHAVTVHVHPTVFNKIHREYAGKDPKKDVTFLQVNTTPVVFVRYAPEKESSLVLAEDLKKLTLRELVDLKLAQDKK